MSTTIEGQSESPLQEHSEKQDLDLDLEIGERKRPRDYHFRLASESSKASEDDTESICSLQDKETDVVRDTSDTESQNDESQIDKDEAELEYEVASLSENDVRRFHVSSSDPENMVLTPASAMICQSDLEVEVTDCENSESSSGETYFERTCFSTCAQCRVENDNSMYRYCEKCFQDRKNFYPPRPRRRNRRKKPSVNAPQRLIKSSAQNCLSGMSQDFGAGFSQHPQLNLESFHVPEDASSRKDMSKNKNVSHSSSQSLGKLMEIESGSDKSMPKKKRFCSENLQKKVSLSETDRSESPLCVFCNSAPKDSIFLHTTIGHRCCCYKCAKKTLIAIKRCPICNCAVNKIVKIYTS